MQDPSNSVILPRSVSSRNCSGTHVDIVQMMKWRRLDAVRSVMGATSYLSVLGLEKKSYEKLNSWEAEKVLERAFRYDRNVKFF